MEQITKPGVNFKMIYGYPLYKVGSDGSVWSFAKGTKWKKLNAGTTKSGHQVVVLVRDGVKKSHNVHRLVIEAFIGLCPKGKECLHKDGNPKNNNVDNLRWGTRKENCNDTIRHGRTTLGEKNPRAKLKRSQVVIIKKELAKNISTKKLGERFNVSKNTIESIKRNENWKEVTCN